jgi:hypothetical protein
MIVAPFFIIKAQEKTKTVEYRGKHMTKIIKKIGAIAFLSLTLIFTGVAHPDGDVFTAVAQPDGDDQRRGKPRERPKEGKRRDGKDKGGDRGGKRDDKKRDRRRP